MEGETLVRIQPQAAPRDPHRVPPSRAVGDRVWAPLHVSSTWKSGGCAWSSGWFSSRRLRQGDSQGKLTSASTRADAELEVPRPQGDRGCHGAAVLEEAPGDSSPPARGRAPAGTGECLSESRGSELRPWAQGLHWWFPRGNCFPTPGMETKLRVLSFQRESGSHGNLGR